MSSILGGPRHSFEGVRNARFSQSGSVVAALGTGPARQDILLYDAQTCQLDLRFVDTISGVPGDLNSHLHFSPSDSLVLWNGVLWDRRSSCLVHRFNRLTSFEGGGFHPMRNEVITNSEVWELRKYQLLHSVPSLDQTFITFNTGGDVIFATTRRNFDSWFRSHGSIRNLSSAFRTVDAVTCSEMATIPVNRAVLDFGTEPTDSFVGLITPNDENDKCSSARVYEIGRRRLSADDSGRDDLPSKAEEDEDEDSGSPAVDADGWSPVSPGYPPSVFSISDDEV